MTYDELIALTWGESNKRVFATRTTATEGQFEYVTRAIFDTEMLGGTVDLHVRGDKLYMRYVEDRTLCFMELCYSDVDSLEELVALVDVAARLVLPQRRPHR